MGPKKFGFVIVQIWISRLSGRNEVLRLITAYHAGCPRLARL
jgi:hypothetical protein